MLVVGVKVTVSVQVAPGAMERQLGDSLTRKGGGRLLVLNSKVVLVYWRVAVPVLVRMMFCCVEERPGTLLKMRAVGLRERPGSGEPKPVRVEVMGPVEAWRMR